VPCENTHASREIRMPVTDKANLAGCGLTEGTIYYFDAPNCDTYCGYWKCVIGADNSDNYCGDHSGLTACPACESWDDLVDPPYELIRPSDWTTTYCDRFTETGDCCDDLCPVDCGFGDIIPDDCDTCYDPSDLGWSVSIGWRPIRDAFCALRSDSCTPPATLRTVNVVPTIHNVTSSISGTTLYICVEIKWSWTKSVGDHDCNEVGDSFWDCSPTCVSGDPGNDVIEYTWTNYSMLGMSIPCMTAASTLSSCGSTTGSPTTMCGGVFTLNTTPTAGSSSLSVNPIGWGGNATIFTRNTTYSWNAEVQGACFGCDTNKPSQSGQGILSLYVEASLPERPDPCV